MHLRRHFSCFKWEVWVWLCIFFCRDPEAWWSVLFAPDVGICGPQSAQPDAVQMALGYQRFTSLSPSFPSSNKW